MNPNLQALENLISSTNDDISILSNCSSYLNLILDNINWVGFYLFKNNELVLGPFQGNPACTNIAIGKGVCGTCAKTLKPIIVEDVHKFEGHIACDSASNSEIVIPMFVNNSFYGLLDIDSPNFNRFNNDDLEFLSNAVDIITKKLKG